jgi:hypothetical protein
MTVREQAESEGEARRPSRSRAKPDPFSKHMSVGASLDGRTPDGHFVLAYKRKLLEHIGGKSTVVQQQLIEQASMLALRLRKADQRAPGGVESERASRLYLSMQNMLTKILAQLDGPVSKARAKAEEPMALAGMFAAHARQYPLGVTHDESVEGDVPTKRDEDERA